MGKVQDKLLELVEQNSQLVRVSDKNKRQIKKLKKSNDDQLEHIARLMAVANSVCEIAKEAIAVVGGQREELARPPEEATMVVYQLQQMLRADSLSTFGEDVTSLAYALKKQLGGDVHEQGDGQTVISSHEISEEDAERVHNALRLIFPPEEMGEDDKIICPMEGSLQHTDDPAGVSAKVIAAIEDIAKRVKHFKDEGYAPEDLEVLLPVSFGMAKDDHLHIFNITAVTNADCEKPSVVLRTTAEERSASE